ENGGKKVLIDAGVKLAIRKVFNKMKEFGLTPIDEIILTHSHWDHIQGFNRIKKLNGAEIKVYASENAIERLKNPEKMNNIFGYDTEPIENVNPLKEGDIIDVNGLELEILNFFGHTMDSIAILDRKNKIIYTGDAIIDRYDYNTVNGVFMPPDFNEEELLKTFQKLRDLKNDIDMICLNHFGVWTNEDCDKIINEMEEIHFKTKEAIIKWYNEKPDLHYIAKQYHKTFLSESTIHTKENIHGLELVISWLINGLKLSGYID
ncbi:MAG: MBL fold metallo-hydrolase, partial [Promethearchaeota archaeon]